MDRLATPTSPGGGHQANGGSPRTADPRKDRIDAGRIQILRPGEAVFVETDRADLLFEILSGVVKTYVALEDGRRQIDRFHVAGDLVGIAIDHRHRCSAEAVDDVVVRTREQRGIDILFDRDPSLADRIFGTLDAALACARHHMLLLGRKTARERLASFLLDFAQRRPESNIVSFPMSRSDLADHLGLTVETVSRTMRKFEREGIIEIVSHKHSIVLRNLAALSRMQVGTEVLQRGACALGAPRH